MALPDSFTSHYLFQSANYGLTLPVDHNMPLLAGKLGKQKSLDLSLTDNQFAILLAWLHIYVDLNLQPLRKLLLFIPLAGLKLTIIQS